jgi:hypothetical protein
MRLKRDAFDPEIYRLAFLLPGKMHANARELKAEAPESSTDSSN